MNTSPERETEGGKSPSHKIQTKSPNFRSTTATIMAHANIYHRILHVRYIRGYFVPKANFNRFAVTQPGQSSSKRFCILGKAIKKRGVARINARATAPPRSIFPAVDSSIIDLRHKRTLVNKAGPPLTSSVFEGKDVAEQRFCLSHRMLV